MTGGFCLVAVATVTFTPCQWAKAGRTARLPPSGMPRLNASRGHALIIRLLGVKQKEVKQADAELGCAILHGACFFELYRLVLSQISR